MINVPPAEEIRRIVKKLGITTRASTPLEKWTATATKKSKQQAPAPKLQPCACGKPATHAFGGSGECADCQKARWFRASENRSLIHRI